MIAGVVEVSDVREDKPITELDTQVFRNDDTLALDGPAVCYTMAVGDVAVGDADREA